MSRDMKRLGQRDKYVWAETEPERQRQMGRDREMERHKCREVWRDTGQKTDTEEERETQRNRRDLVGIRVRGRCLRDGQTGRKRCGERDRETQTEMGVG